MEASDKIYVAGHTGLVGSAILRELKRNGYSNIVTKTHEELDLRKQSDVNNFYSEEKPDYVFLSAAKVGGIIANHTYPANFIYDNLLIQTNIIHAAYENDVKKLLFLGSSCIYPKESLQPIKEEYLLSGKLEETNKSYAIAKIAGIIMCQSYNKQYGTKFISLMPTNLYGPMDNFDLETSHVLPALLRKFHEAKVRNESAVQIWGTGSPRREFLYVDDLADASVFLMNNYSDSHIINIGVGKDISIIELAHLIKEITGFKGTIIKDTNKPDGTPRKLLDVSKLMNLGWSPKTTLRDGLTKTYEWYKKQ